MSNKKKKTVDELLEEALVPEGEQPYEIPDNWVWTRLKGVASVKGGKRLPKGYQLTDEKTDFPYIRVTDFNENTINIEKVKYLSSEAASKISRYTISVNDLYISIAGTIGKTGIIPNELDGANLTENAAKIVLGNGVTNKFIHYLFKSSEIQNQIFLSTVSSSQPKLALFRIEELYIPLPSESEQDKIVNKIEILFAKIDEAKQLIEEVKETFELRRAAILNSLLNIDNASEHRLDDIFELINGDRSTNYPKQSDIKNVGIPFVSTKNLLDDIIKNKDMQYITKEKFDSLSRGKLKDNDIVMSIRGSLGKLGIFRCNDIWDTGFINAQLIIFRLKNEFRDCLSDFLMEYMTSRLFKNQIEIFSTGSAQPQLTAKDLKEFRIILPSIEIQREIIKKLNNIKQKEKYVLSNIEKLQVNIELLKKSILKKAFKGELGTNDLSDEPAIELLKSILQEKL